ncbi:TIGR01212 family radical SAM protein [uncultured Faecalibaculum sp.]|uniref:TIGR01212 family radical SAM protein n=1 Tax=uncultured Faecalibaculum sp. TaxID=1729681 RepID=UPI0025EC2166|nr:TIGR01212 family radical SAM protein [uncultured Faecalibaculum sp.]
MDADLKKMKTGKPDGTAAGLSPFPYSDTNKRYHTYSYHLKKAYGHKLAKIPLDAGFTCPNRDGTRGYGGCAFCSSRGSGDTILHSGEDLRMQFEAGLERARQKWPDADGIAYFQSYSNTYAPLPVLQQVLGPVFAWEDAAEVSIATRPDCLDGDKIRWLAEMNRIKPVWVELGLQSAKDSTMVRMNRGHGTACLAACMKQLAGSGIRTCLHIINGLPGESREDMLDTARFVAGMHPDAVKIHMLHVISDSALGQSYLKAPFPLLSMEDYVQIVCNQLELLPGEMVVERITGDGVAENLLAPLWTAKKRVTMNAVDRELARRGSWQGKLYAGEDGGD